MSQGDFVLPALALWQLGHESLRKPLSKLKLTHRP